MENEVIVKLWDEKVGKIIWNEELLYSYFIFDKGFLKNGIEFSPFLLPFIQGSLPVKSEPSMEHVFKNLPPTFADSLPDDFGNEIFRAYIKSTGEKLNPVERLLYIGKRGMGALEYEPAFHFTHENQPLNLKDIVKISSEVLTQKKNINFGKISQEAFLNVLKVGTSAGGARAKIIIAINEKTKELKAGDILHPEGYSYWIAKLDGVTGKNLIDPGGYSKIEYAYYKMAKASGINMTECQLYSDGPRNHFFTKRFDRTENGEKLHMLSLSGLKGFNFKNPVGYSYEDVFDTIRELKLPYSAMEQQYSRAVFNIIARNQDDHAKNISFLMNRKGEWSLSPAYDISYSYNPDGVWTKNHQLLFNGKRNDFTTNDLLEFGKKQGIIKTKKIIERVSDSVSRWETIAKEIDIPKHQIDGIKNGQRLYLGMNKQKGLQF